MSEAAFGLALSSIVLFGSYARGGDSADIAIACVASIAYCKYQLD